MTIHGLPSGVCGRCWRCSRSAPARRGSSESRQHLGDRRRLGRLRLIADLFDHYGVRRPAMLRAWARGEDVDASGAALAQPACWQPELWRRLRARIASPSPAERLDAACAALIRRPLARRPARAHLAVRAHPAAGELRPGARGARHRPRRARVPAAPLPRPVARGRPGDGRPRPARALAGGRARHPRARDTTGELAVNRLLRSWGADSRQLQLVLTGAGEHADHHHTLGDADDRPDTLLKRIQDDVRANNPPPGPPLPGELDLRLELAPDDRSISVHACHGPARQVEVLREAIMHLLAEDPTLEPRDVIVMCPDIETFAPLIQATFGTAPADQPDEFEPGANPTSGSGSPTGRCARRTRSSRSSRELIELAELRADRLADARPRLSRARPPPLPVRRRRPRPDPGLDRRVPASAGVSTPPTGHVPARGAAGRDLAGRAAAAAARGRDERGGPASCTTDVLPLDDVESGAIELAGRFAEFVHRVGAALDSLAGPHTVPAGPTRSPTRPTRSRRPPSAMRGSDTSCARCSPTWWRTRARPPPSPCSSSRSCARCSPTGSRGGRRARTSAPAT